MAITFNGETKIIGFDALPTELSVIDLYSRWKQWVLAGNAGFLHAFEPVGGQDVDVAQGTRVPLYAFLVNGWKIQPYLQNHTLNVTQGILLQSGGGDPFLDAAGFTVRVNYQQPVQAIGVPSTANHWQEVIEAGLTAADMLRLLAAVSFGKSSGGGTTEIKFRSVMDDIDRIIGTVDSSGNRTAVTLDP